MKILFLVFLLLGSLYVVAQFTPGNLVVSRVGNGTTALSNDASLVQLVEYTKTGMATGYVVSMPVTSNGLNRACTNSGTSTSEGSLNLSVDGRYLLLGGYDAALGTANVATSNTNPNRVVARVDRNGLVNTVTNFISNSTTASAAYYQGSIRSVASVDGSAFWVSGNESSGSNGGIRYIALNNGNATGTQISTTTTNTRHIGIFNGQLYTTANTTSPSLRMASVGTGLPTTTGQLIANLNGFTNTAIGPYGFIFFDRDPLVAGVDLLYVVGLGVTTDAGLLKYSYDGTTWTARGSIIGTGTGVAQIQSITGTINCNNEVELYFTRSVTANQLPTQLRKYIDMSAYNANLSFNGAADIATVSNLLATAGANYFFRGVSFTPSEPEIISTGPLTGGGVYNNVTVQSGGNLIIPSAGITVNGKFTIESGGIVECVGNIVGTDGSQFELKAGGTLIMHSPDGIATTGAIGNVQTCVRSFSTQGNYEYKGNVTQVTGSALPGQINNLTINKSVNNVSLTNPVTVNGTLTLTQGKLNTTATNLLTLSAISNVVSGPSAYTNVTFNTNYGTADSYINGPMRWNGLVASLLAPFPVGDASLHRPAFLVNATGDFTVEYIRSNPWAFGLTLDVGLDHTSSLEYWLITRNSGSGQANVKLTYYDPNSGGVTNVADLRVARWNGTLWVNEGNTATQGSPGTNGSVTSTVVSNYSPFTLASINPNNPLPVKDIKLNYVKNNALVNLQWSVLGDQDVATYAVERSNDGLNFVNDISINSKKENGIATYKSNGYICTTVAYFRIKAVLDNGQITYSSIIVVPVGKIDFVLYPNPAKNNIQVSTSHNNTRLLITDALGKMIKLVSLKTNSEIIDVSDFSNGIYFARLMNAGKLIKTIYFVKE